VDTITAGVFSAAVAGNGDGGTGYAVDDTITVADAFGTGTNAVLTVASVDSGGVVTAVTVSTAGAYTALGGGGVIDVAQKATSGSGSGATFDLTLSVVSVAVNDAGAGYPSVPGITVDNSDSLAQDATAASPATVCAANEYVSSNACTPCAAGTTNAAGDVASGANTACDKTTCAADEYVKSNACAACAAGSTNAANDDASGADTSCDVVSGASHSVVKATTMISFLVFGFLALAM